MGKKNKDKNNSEQHSNTNESVIMGEKHGEVTKYGI